MPGGYPVPRTRTAKAYVTAGTPGYRKSRNPLQPTNGFRLDRTVSVRLVHPVIRMLDRKVRTRIPILMYHGIRDGVGTKHPYFETNTSPRLFARHMQFLLENGFVPVHLDEAIEAMYSDIK